MNATKTKTTTTQPTGATAMTIEFKAIECETAREAIRIVGRARQIFADEWTRECGRCDAITFGGKYYVAQQVEIDRLAAAGVQFAYICDHYLPDGERIIVTIPVN